jgi:hypothetical protein
MIFHVFEEFGYIALYRLYDRCSGGHGQEEALKRFLDGIGACLYVLRWVLGFLPEDRNEAVA